MKRPQSASLDQPIKFFHGVRLLLEKIDPDVESNSIENIIELNAGMLKSSIQGVATNDWLKLIDVKTLERMNEHEKKWIDPNVSNFKRKLGLFKLLKFTTDEHTEMLDLKYMKKLISLDIIKAGMAKSTFINFSIKEKAKNIHLSIQSHLLQIFYFYHLKGDFKFKAKIDSVQIEMDDPFSRHQIRSENREDQSLGGLYLGKFQIDEWCKHLLENFFPNIAGIWADHTHSSHVYIFKIIRFCFECGLIDKEDSIEILSLLYRACIGLLKLEEAWTERTSRIHKLSESWKAYNLIKQFTECREHVASILFQIVTLLQDDYFMEKFPVYLSKGLSQEQCIKKIENDLKEGDSPFFNEEMNEKILFIVMNYLSKQCELGFQKTGNASMKKVVDKMFISVTTSNKDSFIESIKQISSIDLKYLQEGSAIPQNFMDKANNIGAVFRDLIMSIGTGSFNKEDQSAQESFKRAIFKSELNDYIPQEKATFSIVFTKILDSIRADLDSHDFKVALVKESVPLALLALANYARQFFTMTSTLRTFFKELFAFLNVIAINNNSCKAQILKGDGLYHFKSLLLNENKYAFFFLNKLADEDNIAMFLGRGLLGDIIQIYRIFQKRVIEDISHLNDLGKQQSDGDKIEMDDWSLFIILNKFFDKLMKKNFLDELEKLKCALSIQEAIFLSLSEALLPKLIELLNNPQKIPESQPPESIFLNTLFKAGNEDQMVRTLEIRDDNEEISQFDAYVVLLQVCFSAIKAFNTVCSEAFSSIIVETMGEYVHKLKEWIINNDVAAKQDFEPFGLDTEVLKLIKTFDLIPEASFLIERKFGLQSADNQVFDKEDTPLNDIETFLSRAEKYKDQHHLKEEGQLFIIEGLLPFIYKYLNAVLNLTNYGNRVKLSGDTDTLLKTFQTKRNDNNNRELWARLQQLMAKNSVHYSLEMIIEIYFLYQGRVDSLMATMDRHNPGELLGSIGILAQYSKVFNKNSNPDPDIVLDRKTMMLEEFAQSLMRDIEKFYKGTRYENIMHAFKGLKKEDYKKSTAQSVSSLDEKSLENMHADRKLVLDSFVTAFQNVKIQYLEVGEPDSQNLISFFDRNTDNLKGVFESCLGSFYSTTKQERSNLKEMLTKDLGTNRFWMNQSCFAYILMLERLISKSVSARDEFYQFIMKDDDEEDNEEDPPIQTVKDVVAKTEIVSSNNKANVMDKLKNWKPKVSGEVAEVVRGKHLIGMLSRVQQDSLLFLSTNPTQKPIWWNVFEMYEKLCSFFKNLCESNHLEFKKYLGLKIPLTKDSEWNIPKNTYIEIFSYQLNYLLNASRIAQNKDSNIVHSDQFHRIGPLLLPLINVLNEMVTVPCEENQKIVFEQSYGATAPNSEPSLDLIFKLMTRVIDDLEDDFYEIKHNCLIFLLSLVEDSKKHILSMYAKKLSPSVLVNQVQRIIKKVYVKKLLVEKKFESKQKEYQMLKLRETRRKKNRPKLIKDQAKQQSTQSSSNQVAPSQGSQEGTISTDDIDKAKKNPNDIPQTLEASVIILDWEELDSLYMDSQEFSEGLVFDFFFRITILWETISGHSKRHRQRLDELRRDAKNHFENGGKISLSPTIELYSIFYFLNHITLNIEIRDKTGRNLTVYFPRRPECFMLSEEAKKDYRSECDISDANTKMLDLMRNFQLFNIQMEGNLKSYRSSSILYSILSNDSFKLYTFVLWFASLVLNILIGVFVVRNEAGVLNTKEDFQQLIIFVLALLIAGASSFFLVAWLIARYLQVYNVELEDFKFDNPGANLNSIINFTRVALLDSILLKPAPCNMLFHVILCLFGALSGSYFILSLNLLLIINISRTTKFVVKATFLHVDQLVLTLVLTVFIVYTYSIIIASSYYEGLQYNEDTDKFDVCKDLYTCFIFTINLGLRNGGGIADSMSIEPVSNTRFYVKSLHDVSFFLVVNVIALNIIFGIIIDTFSQLRDEEHERSKLLS